MLLLVRRFDANEDGRLEQSELRTLWCAPASVYCACAIPAACRMPRMQRMRSCRCSPAAAAALPTCVPLPPACAHCNASIIETHRSGQLGTEISDAEAKEAIRLLDSSNTGFIQFSDFVCVAA